MKNKRDGAVIYSKDPYNVNYVDYKCCKAKHCPEVNSTEWTCSNIYSDNQYAAMNMCPYRTHACGREKSEIGFFSINNVQVVETKGLRAGEVCTYNIFTSCSSPSFMVRNDSTANPRHVEVLYLEGA